MLDVLYNQFDLLPFIPYNIMLYLLDNEEIWKILKYDEYDCLDKPNLTEDEKLSMIWRGEENQQDYNVFLTTLDLDSVKDSRTIIKLYDYMISPENHITSIVCMKFDLICLGKTGVINYKGATCNRTTVLKTLLLQALNGADVGGVGMLMFDNKLSRWCGSTQNLGNNKNAQGDSLIMALRTSTLKDENGKD